MSPGAVTGVTLSAPDDVVGFYGALLGWGVAPGNVLLDSEGVPVAALVGGTAGWCPVLDGTAGNVAAAGGTATGSAASDPSGVAFGIGTPAVPLAAPGPGRPVWFEHMSLDAPAADRFYPAAFGWGVTPAGPEYALFTNGEGPFAGRLALVPELAAAVGERWMVYLAHGDADGGAATAARLGGAVVVPPRDTPTGRLAAVTDPSGAVFTLLTPP
jgi:uncharacterized protein